MVLCLTSLVSVGFNIFIPSSYFYVPSRKQKNCLPCVLSRFISEFKIGKQTVSLSFARKSVTLKNPFMHACECDMRAHQLQVARASEDATHNFRVAASHIACTPTTHRSLMCCIPLCVLPRNLVPRASLSLTSGRKPRALGASILK